MPLALIVAEGLAVGVLTAHLPRWHAVPPRWRGVPSGPDTDAATVRRAGARARETPYLLCRADGQYPVAAHGVDRVGRRGAGCGQREIGDDRGILEIGDHQLAEIHPVEMVLASPEGWAQGLGDLHVSSSRSLSVARSGRLGERHSLGHVGKGDAIAMRRILGAPEASRRARLESRRGAAAATGRRGRAGPARRDAAP